MGRGADSSAQGRAGCTPLYLARQNVRESIVAYLVERGADVNAKTSAGCTPLYLASQKGHESIVEYLVERGADVNAQTSDGCGDRTNPSRGRTGSGDRRVRT